MKKLKILHNFVVGNKPAPILRVLALSQHS